MDEKTIVKNTYGPTTAPEGSGASSASQGQGQAGVIVSQPKSITKNRYGPETGAAGGGATTSQRVEELNRMYDAQLESQKSQLQGAYEQSRSAAQAARDRLPQQYQQQANDLAVQYERTRRNFNQQAAGSGINTGTASQAALAQASTWQRDYGNLRTAEAQDIAEADRGLADLEAEYQRQVSAAMAQNDYERSAALLREYEEAYQRQLQQDQWAYQKQQDALNRQFQQDQWAYQKQQDALEQEYRRQTDEYNRRFQQDQWAYQKEQDALGRQDQQDQTNYQRQQSDYARQLDEAAMRAQWGDFSGYAALYGQEQADDMRQLWLFQNPEMAYTLGEITAEQYRSLTGKNPTGTSSVGGNPIPAKTAEERDRERMEDNGDDNNVETNAGGSGAGGKYTFDDFANDLKGLTHSNQVEDVIKSYGEAAAKGLTDFTPSEFSKYLRDNHL